MPILPTSAAQLEDFQWQVRVNAAQASGPVQKRTNWLHTITDIKNLTKLRKVSRKVRTLDQKIATAAMLCAQEQYTTITSSSERGKGQIKSLTCSARAIATPAGVKTSYAIIDLANVQLRC
jgi:hypothetical protein